MAFEIKGRRLEVPLEDVFTLQFMGKLCPCGTPRTRDLKMAHRVGRSRSPISELTNKMLLLVNSELLINEMYNALINIVFLIW